MSRVLPALEELIRIVKNVGMVGRKTKKEHASVRKLPMAWGILFLIVFNACKTHGKLCIDEMF